MIATLQSGGSNLPLFLHVLGATILFGALSAVALLAAIARRRPEQERLARAVLGTLLAAAVPAWVLLYTAGTWTESKENLRSGLHWVDVPQSIADAGFVFLLLLTGSAFAWKRQPASSWRPRAVLILSLLYLCALGVAWWIMTAKPML